MNSKWKTTVAIFIILFGLIKSTAGSAPTRVTKCIDDDVSQTIKMECDPGSTIRIIKGICTRVSSCDAYDPYLESQCDGSDRTAQWAPYCETRNPCFITCARGSDCSGYASYVYSDYECISDDTSAAPTTTSAPPSQRPVPDPAPSRPDIVHQKSSLFKQIQERRLLNHVIETKHGLSLISCGAKCKNLDDCVSFNIGNGACELNNRVVGGAGVSKDDFVVVEGYKYYEKQ